MNSSKITALKEAPPYEAQWCEQWQHLVSKIVNGLRWRIFPHAYAGALNAAQWGLIQAIRGYKSERGTFESYARLRIRGEIMDELRRQDHLTRGQRKMQITFLELDVVCDLVDESQPSPVENALRSERSAERYVAAEALLHLMPPSQAQMFRWRYWHGLSQREIGRIMGRSETAVSTRMHITLRQIRKSAAINLDPKLQAVKEEAKVVEVVKQMEAKP